MMGAFIPKKKNKEETEQIAMEIEWSKELKIEDKIQFHRAKKRKAIKLALPEKLKRTKMTNNAPSKVLSSIKIYAKPITKLNFKQTDLNKFSTNVSKSQLKCEKGQPNLFLAGKIT